MFKVTRVYADENGDSRFDELEIPLEASGEIGFLSELIPAKGVVFREVLPTYNFDFHNVPQREYIILLDGKIEIETSLGEKKIFGAGDVLLMEDIGGKGHKTRNLIGQKRKSVFIRLE